MALNPKVLQTAAAMMKASQATFQTKIAIFAPLSSRGKPTLTPAEVNAMEREVLAALALDDPEPDADPLVASNARQMLAMLSGDEP